MNNLFDTTRILFAKLRIERPTFVVAPRFTTTFFILWLIALFGLFHGHLWSKGEGARSLSVFLSGTAAFSALFIVLLKDPWFRFKVFFRQLIALLLFLAFIAVSLLAYSLTNLVPNITPSIQFAWMAGAFLLGYLALRSLFGTFLNARIFNEYVYPGMRSTSLLFFLFIINYVWWFGSQLLTSLR